MMGDASPVATQLSADVKVFGSVEVSGKALNHSTNVG